jgi:predicted Rossmann-fold nucleotide-binding protein
MPSFSLPYQPIRTSLYSAAELFGEFDPQAAASFAQTVDFQTYRDFVRSGGSRSQDFLHTMLQSLHDHSISQSIRTLLKGRACCAIMGGHKISRKHASYQRVAELSRLLTSHGLLVATGGGPGAMEAGHFGAALATHSAKEMRAALQELRKQPDLPESLKHILRPDGSADPQVVKEAHAWFAPAWEIRQGLTSPGESLAVPTWHYGHEPTSPFATHIGKYFQNSIREEGLLAIAQQGIVYTEGKAGTIQEIFQDAAQNYYESFDYFSPMVFLGVAYWTKTYPLIPVLRKLFGPERTRRFVRVTDDVSEAAEFLIAFRPPVRER